MSVTYVSLDIVKFWPPQLKTMMGKSSQGTNQIPSEFVDVASGMKL